MPINLLKFFFTSLCLLLLLSGFGKSPDAQSGKPRVALVMKSLANEFFKNMVAGAKHHQSQHAEDYELITNGIENGINLAEQVNLVAQMASHF